MNFLKNISLVVISFALVVFGAFSLPSTTQAAPETISAGSIDFSTPQTISDAVKVASDKGLTIAQLQGEFSLGSFTTVDFFPVKSGQDIPTLEREYKKARLGYLRSIIEGQSKKENKAKFSDKQIADIQAALTKGDAGSLTIKNIKVLGEEQAIESLGSVGKVTVIHPQSLERLKSFAPKSKDNQVNPTIDPQKISIDKAGKIKTLGSGNTEGGVQTMLAQTLPSVPSTGYIDVYTPNPSTYPNQKEIISYMLWTNMNFGATQAYEHEFFSDNHDGQSLFSTATQAPWGGNWVYNLCVPSVNYAATNFPAGSRPYLDTRLYAGQDSEGNYGIGCESYELEFTIGAYQANQLSVNTTYYTYFRVNNGNATTDRLKASGQVGHQDNSFFGQSCPSGLETWCVYGDDPNQGDKHVDFIQAWKSPIPWNYYWDWSVRFCEHDRNGGYGSCIDRPEGTYGGLNGLGPLYDNKLTTVRFPDGLAFDVIVADNYNAQTNTCYGTGWLLPWNGSGRIDVNLYDYGMNFNDKTSCIQVTLH